LNQTNIIYNKRREKSDSREGKKILEHFKISYNVLQLDSKFKNDILLIKKKIPIIIRYVISSSNSNLS